MNASSEQKQDSSGPSNESTGPVFYKSFPCACTTHCRKCAMKMATGGKCKVCKEFFTSMTCIEQEKLKEDERCYSCDGGGEEKKTRK